MASSSSSSSTTRPVVVVTLVFRGQSEALPVEDLTAMTVQDCTEWAAALFGLENNNTDSSSSGSNSNSNDNMLSSSSSVHLYKDGVPLIPRNSSNISLHQAGIRHGDVIAVRVVGGGEQEDVATPSATTTSATGLDFSALLASSHNDTNINASFPRSSSTSTSSPLALAYTYYPGMSLSEAQHCNPHPTAFVTLLHDQQSNNNNNNKNEDSHLLKELHYYDPLLATQLRDSLFPTVSASAASSTTTTTSQEARLIQAAQIWRQAMVKGGIERAMRASTEYQTTQSMRNRLARDPHDAEAKAFFERTERLSTIDEQYRHAMEEYPETFGRVLMLYIAASIHGTPIQAFCDSGAQMTIMSHRLAVACGIADLIDTRLAGVAVGVGTGVLLGRIHTVQLQIGESHFFPCSVTVMEDPPPGSKAKEMPFLLGLDMMKRHTCLLDLERGCLRFRLGSRSDTNSIDDNYLEAPFLHEKDLTEEQGGTKGFDADKANQELLAAQQQHAAARGNEPSDDADDDAMKDS